MSINWNEVITPKSFPFEVKSFRLVQTHISYVFITDKWVYKIKKPVDFGFLDFTTLEKRKFFCEKEVELNRRLCPEIYIGVVPVVKKGNEFFFEGEGEPVEYAVKMKPFPEEGIMLNLLKKKEVTTSHIDLINSKLVPFYKNARADEEVAKYGKVEVVKFNIDENFAQTKDFVNIAIPEYKYRFIVDYNEKFFKEKTKLFEERIKGGFIREGHGDLYSANICFEDLKNVYIFDCIEFNERFRCGDVASDIAFLAMDLDFHRERELSNYFVEKYIQKSGDEGLREILDFYKCYRAYVRGKIGCFTYASPGISEEEKRTHLENARKYFDLAYLYAGGIPKIVIFMGLSGSGKSFLARALNEVIGGVYLSSDVIRKKLAGLSPETKCIEDFEKGIYSSEFSEKTYKEMARIAVEEASYGRDVILDATFKNKAYRDWVRDTLKEAKAEVYWIWCYASDEVIKQRLDKRQKEGDVSDGRWEIYVKQKETYDPPEECSPILKLNTDDSKENLLNQLKNFLKI